MLTNKIFSMNLVTWHKLGMPYLLAEHNLKPEFCIECQPNTSKPKPQDISAKKINKDATLTPSIARNSYSIPASQAHAQAYTRPTRPALANNAIINNQKINNIQPKIQVKHEEIPIPNPIILPLHSWATAWKDLLTNKNSAKVLWTYSGLGDDISGQGNIERKELVRRLIKELAFPAGTHAFWPLNLPKHEDQQLNAQIFWGAAERLEARAIVIMGSTALNAFNLPRKLRPLQQTVYKGYMLIVLPDINFLLEDISKYPSVREFIRTALNRYAHS